MPQNCCKLFPLLIWHFDLSPLKGLWNNTLYQLHLVVNNLFLVTLWCRQQYKRQRSSRLYLGKGFFFCRMTRYVFCRSWLLQGLLHETPPVCGNSTTTGGNWCWANIPIQPTSPSRSARSVWASKEGALWSSLRTLTSCTGRQAPSTS